MIRDQFQLNLNSDRLTVKPVDPIKFLKSCFYLKSLREKIYIVEEYEVNVEIGFKNLFWKIEN